MEITHGKTFFHIVIFLLPTALSVNTVAYNIGDGIWA